MPTWKGFNEAAYVAELGNAWNNGVKIWNIAYMQNDLQNYAHVSPKKYPRYIRLLKDMMSTDVTGKLQAAKTYQDPFQVLHAYPLYEDFIGMQHLTDINYSEVINFDEDDFIVPGPGALNGIRKCWGILPVGVTPSDIIHGWVKDQDKFSQRSKSRLSGYSESDDCTRSTFRISTAKLISMLARRIPSSIFRTAKVNRRKCNAKDVS